jgi:hypothetical protein
VAEAVEAGEIVAKTVNNTLATLVVCLNQAVDDGLLVANPALRVRRLPAAPIEREYLRLEEIPRYLDGCSDVYRPLAELLVGRGLLRPGSHRNFGSAACWTARPRSETWRSSGTRS